MATRISGLLLCVAGSFVVSTAFAQDTTKINNFSIAAEVSNYKYKEPGVMKVTGTMYGVTGEYLNSGGVGRIKGTIPVQFRARFTYMQGNDLDYDGGYAVGNQHYSFKRGGVHQSYFDTVFAGGFEAKVSEKLFISPYLGFGYRYLLDKDDGAKYDRATNTLVLDYKREQTYYYLPLGADFKIPLGSGWRLAFNGEFDILLRGENTSHIRDGYGKREVRQNSGYGVRASTKVEKHLQSVGFFAEPFYRYWNISKSTEDHGWEPKNNTNEFGLRIGAIF